MAFPISCLCSAGSVAGVIILYLILWKLIYGPAIEQSFTSWAKDRVKR